jgi:hypothetical protein
MIQLFLQKFRESTMSILIISFLLTGIGLIALKSISTGHEGHFYSNLSSNNLFFYFLLFLHF